MQPSDIKQAVITGGSSAVTGGAIVGPEQTMVIKSVHYSNVSGNTGNVIRLAAIPSGGNVDVKSLTATGNEATLPGGDGVIGSIPHDNVMQVTTDNNNVIVRVAYIIEEGR